MSNSATHRDIVSFVRRSARMNESQAKAWDRYHHCFVVDVAREDRSTTIAPDFEVDWDEVFQRRAPRIVEIGSGAGDSLVPMAAARPEVDFVALEVFQPAVASTLGRIGRAGISNVRVVLADGQQGLSRLFSESTLREVWTFFADPWHKTRHHKRRLVSPWFADVVASRLEPGGLWRLATDWQDYAQWQRDVLDRHASLVNVHGGWAPRHGARPVTKYEQRGLDQGRSIFDLTYRKTDPGAADAMAD